MADRSPDHSLYEVPMVRWLVFGFGLVAVTVYAVLTGNGQYWAVLVVALVFLHLFYRLVVAVERIADRS
ncbi:hypothetical protein [Halopiger djelfimassiliensis]|uniref:hypothetical protein n=1 Tax=Halopiger djelfimassiliensis TaxID=1293047 RepID=UPI0006778304|nr:hypothetical protein [Halopiger djelfimassiliensis]